MTDQSHTISAAQAGDSNALRALLDQHYHTIYKMAYRWCGHTQDAEDVAQEACIKIALNIDSFKGKSAFTTWFYPIVMNTARDLFRTRAANRVREANYAESRSLEDGQAPTPEDQAQGQEALNAIAALPDDLKATVLLVAGEGLNHKQAGAILNCAEGTISWRMNKAREQLTHVLGEA